MKNLSILLATLVLLVTIGLRPVSKSIALNAANDVATVTYTIAGVDGDGGQGLDSYNSWAG